MEFMNEMNSIFLHISVSICYSYDSTASETAYDLVKTNCESTSGGISIPTTEGTEVFSAYKPVKAD